jgi:hypothetical protein
VCGTLVLTRIHYFHLLLCTSIFSVCERWKKMAGWTYIVVGLATIKLISNVWPSYKYNMAIFEKSECKMSRRGSHATKVKLSFITSMFYSYWQVTYYLREVAYNIKNQNMFLKLRMLYEEWQLLCQMQLKY